MVIHDNLNELDLLANDSIGYKIYLSRTTGNYILPFDYLQHALSKISLADKPVTIHYEGDVSVVLDQVQIYDKINIAHVPTAEVLKTIREYKEKGYKVACEVTPHHTLLTLEDGKKLGNFAKMIPPLQTNEDRLFLIEGMKNGWVDFYATDHAPHTMEEKESDNSPSGVPGDDTYGNTVALLIKEYAIPSQQMMRLTSYNAAQFFGLNDRGRIEVGKRADITVLDLEHPETISSKNLYTKCGWSPFEGWTFPGRVAYTIHDGKIMSKNGIVIKS